MLLVLSPHSFLKTQDSLTNNVATTAKFRYGLFETFNDFKANTPSITSGFYIDYDIGKFVRATLRFDKGKKIGRVYAFSDSINLYVNARIYSELNYFLPVLMVGPVVYFEDYLGRRIVETHATGLVGVRVAGTFIANFIGKAIATDNPGWLIYLLDDEGYAYTMDKKTVGSILQNDDNELFERFKADNRPKNNAVLKEYIQEFNLRNAHLSTSNRR